MSVKLQFCGFDACEKIDVDWLDYLLKLPLKYSDLKNRVRYTSGYVIYDEDVITEFWTLFSTSPATCYFNKYERLEIEFENVWFADGFGYE